MTDALTSWSYSRWDKHHECPLRFKLEVLDKRKDPDDEDRPSFIKGRKVHKALADYFNGPTDAVVPPEAGKQTALAAQVKAEFDNIVVEQQWGYNRKWEPTGWFAKASDPHGATWLRGIIDLGVLYEDDTVEVIDWKTGKPRATYTEELELFAVTVMQRFPFVTHVTTRLAYTEFDKAVFAEHPRSELPRMIEQWEERVRPMFQDTTFLPRPGEHCKWCRFSRSRTMGQDCRYG